MIIDAHTHLWKQQKGLVNGKTVTPLENGRSDFGGELRQMMPPYMTKCQNTADMLISNMDYAGVNGAVITQEEIDGNQDEYLLNVKRQYPERIKICSLYEENKPYELDGFDGIKICAGRLTTQDLTKHFSVFQQAYINNKFISIDLADGNLQTEFMREIIQQLPELKIAIGHFGMVTTNCWKEQIKLAQNKNVYIESGGITWLFNSEFYPYPSAIEAINEASELCGFNKLMWGSDYPRTMVEITYKMSFDFIKKSKEISEENKHKFLYENAKAFYEFDNLKPMAPIKNML